MSLRIFAAPLIATFVATAFIATGCGTELTLRTPVEFCTEMDGFLKFCGDKGAALDCEQKIETCDPNQLDAANAYLDCVVDRGCGDITHCMKQNTPPTCAAEAG